jgi:hypothetical protein
MLLNTNKLTGGLMSEAVDEDTVNRKSSGLLGMQVHIMPNYLTNPSAINSACFKTVSIAFACLSGG